MLPTLRPQYKLLRVIIAQRTDNHQFSYAIIRVKMMTKKKGIVLAWSSVKDRAWRWHEPSASQVTQCSSPLLLNQTKTWSQSCQKSSHHVPQRKIDIGAIVFVLKKEYTGMSEYSDAFLGPIASNIARCKPLNSILQERWREMQTYANSLCHWHWWCNRICSERGVCWNVRVQWCFPWAHRFKYRKMQTPKWYLAGALKRDANICEFSLSLFAYNQSGTVLRFHRGTIHRKVVVRRYENCIDIIQERWALQWTSFSTKKLQNGDCKWCPGPILVRALLLIQPSDFDPIR